MSSLHELYHKLENLVAANDTSKKPHQDIDPAELHVADTQAEAEEQEKLENIRAAYRTLQELAKELKPTMNNFFETFSNDIEPKSNDEANLKAINAKLKVFMALCPGIRMAYLLEKEARCSDVSDK